MDDEYDDLVIEDDAEDWAAEAKEYEESAQEEAEAEHRSTETQAIIDRMRSNQ